MTIPFFSADYGVYLTYDPANEPHPWSGTVSLAEGTVPVGAVWGCESREDAIAKAKALARDHRGSRPRSEYVAIPQASL